MIKIGSFWNKFWPVLVFIFIEILIFAANYIPETFLVGWDNTMPELNLRLNLERIIFGVWQDYRGLGTLDGMAHTANIMHWFQIAVLSIFLPTNLVRYIYLLLTHILGGIGMYFLIKDTVLNKTINAKNLSEFQKKSISILGGLFYQLNLITVQMFFIPLELFSIHFAVIPWSLYGLEKYLRSPTKRNLGVFALINILGVSQAHVPSIFISYAILIAIVLAFYLLKDWKQNLKYVLAIITTLFVVNSFWGLPYVYSAINKSSEISQTKINQFSTDDIFYRNKAWGGLIDIFTFGGFNLDYTDWDDKSEKFVPLLGVWNDLYESPIYKLICTIISLCAVAGLILLLKNNSRKNPLVYGLVLSWLFFFSMLAIEAPVISLVSKLFREYIPYFHDIFRFTFTKFSIIYVALTSVFFSLFLGEIFTTANKKLFNFILFAAITSAFIFISLPIFKGNFFYSHLRQKIPSDYFELAEAIKEYPKNERVVILPSPTFYGWTNNRWGFRGSGFLWQMIPQPMINRAFDAWSATNETFYFQLNNAIQSRDQESFYKVISKYNISMVLIDRSIFQPSATDTNLNMEFLNNLLQNNNFVEVKRTDLLSLYRIKTATSQLIYSPNHYTEINTDYQFKSIIYDTAYASNGDYIIKESNNVYPFTEFQKESLSNIITNNNNLTLKREFTDYKPISIPEYGKYHSEVLVKINASVSQDEVELKITPLLPDIRFKNEFLNGNDKYIEKKYSFREIGLNNLTFEIDENFYKLEELEKGTTIFISHIKPIRLRAYGGQDVISDITNQFVDQEGDVCWNHPKDFWFAEKKLGSNEARLKNASLCFDLDLNTHTSDNEIEELYLNEVSFKFSATPFALPDTCIMVGFNQYCKKFTDDDSDQIRIYAPTASRANILQKIKMTPDPIGIDSKQSYTDIILRKIPYIFEDSIDISTIVRNYDNNISKSTNSNQLEITLPIKIIESSENKYSKTSNNHQTKTINCSDSDPEKANINYSDDFFTLEAVNGGSACYSLKFSDLPNNKGLFINTSHEKLSGTPVKLGASLSNNFQKVGDFTFTEEFGTNSFQLPQTTMLENDMELNFFLKNYGNENTKVSIRQINMSHIPSQWLSQITAGDNQKVENELKINSIVHTRFASLVKTENSGVITYNSSFDRGWVAFSPKNGFLNHYIYNGWSNAWEIPDASATVLILFWPNLISFFGYSILLFGVIYFCFRFIASTKSDHKMSVKKALIGK